jgi:amidophosphoribosyltransferase
MEPEPVPVSISDSPREECGVLGVSTPHGEGVAQITFFGLFALQHRGQEAAGIAGQRRSARPRPQAAGLVSHVFTNDTLKPLTGYHSIGHTRYSTTGSSNERNIQPFVVETMHGRWPSPTTATSSTRRPCATSCCTAASA